MKKPLMFLLTILCFAANAPAQTKTITNADLEKYRLERLKNDPDDERERQRRNLPSRAEEEQARQLRAAETNEIANRIRVREADAQNYWQEQAFPLRAEIAAVEAEINYVRARLGEIAPPQTFYAVGYNPYYGNCCSYGGSTYRNSVTTVGIGGSIAIGRKSQISLGAGVSRRVYKQSGQLINQPYGIGQNNFLRRRPRSFVNGVFVAPFVLPTQQNLTREELLSSLRELEQARAGLYARFAVLEEAAHQGGVKLN
jgi:hypothetical protein